MSDNVCQCTSMAKVPKAQRPDAPNGVIWNPSDYAQSPNLVALAPQMANLLEWFARSAVLRTGAGNAYFCGDDRIDLACTLVKRLKAKKSRPHRRTVAQYGTAIDACAQLVAAYRAGKRNGGSIEWSDVDAAYEMAKAALR